MRLSIQFGSAGTLSEGVDSANSEANLNIPGEEMETDELCTKLEVMSTSKSYAHLLVDRPFYEISKQNETALYLLYCLRYRGKIVLNERNPASGRRASSIARQTQNTVKSVLSMYDTLLHLLSQYDASGRVEIFRLLLERNSPVPLFLPNGQHHLPLFGLLTKELGNNNTICLGQDTQLMRVAVVSCRDKKHSSSAELVHPESSRRQLPQARHGTGLHV